LEDLIHWCYTTNLDLLQQTCNRQADAIVAAKYIVENHLDIDTNVQIQDDDPRDAERENIKITKNKQHKIKSVDLPLIAKHRLSQCNKEWSIEAELKFELSDFFSRVGSAQDLAKLLKQSDVEFYVENALAMYEESYAGIDISKSKFISAIANDLWQLFSRLAYENSIMLVSNINISLKDKFIISNVDAILEHKDSINDLYDNFVVPAMTRWFVTYKSLYEGKKFKVGDINDMFRSKDKFSMGWIMQCINIRNHTASLDKFNKLLDIVTSQERGIKHDLFTREDIRQEVVILDANYVDNALDDLERGQPDQSIVMRM
jgi:hypothetical protein